MATAFRAAETLVACGFARPDPSGHGYVASLDVVELAGAIIDRTSIKSIARETLAEVARTFGETVTLAIREGDHVVFIDRIEGTSNVRFFCDIGRRLPLHAGAAARCILAHLPDDDFAAYTSRTDLEALTPRTRVDQGALERDRHDIHRHGFAVSVDEVDTGVSAIGVCILNQYDEVLAAAAIANLTARWKRADIRGRAAAMREAAVRIQHRCRPLRPTMVAAS